MRTLCARQERFRLKQPFTIARDSVTAVEVVTVTLTEQGVSGRGECRPYARYGESCASVIGEIERHRAILENGADRRAINAAMRGGAARNAVDCALWDLEAKMTGVRAWQRAGLAEPARTMVTYTISLGSPAEMARQARLVQPPLLKLKLGGDGDLERVAAVREAAPDSRLIVDANEAWRADEVARWAIRLAELGVELIEQPLHADADASLSAIDSPVPLCADESCHTADDIAALRAKYRFVNIKLDKTGGLTAAIDLAEQAKQAGLAIMLGCMMASSLSMAPAFLLANRARYVDLDAPLLLAEDRANALTFEGAVLRPPRPELWG